MRDEFVEFRRVFHAPETYTVGVRTSAILRVDANGSGTLIWLRGGRYIQVDEPVAVVTEKLRAFGEGS